MSLIDLPPRKIDTKYKFYKVNYRIPLQFEIRPMKEDKSPQRKLYGNYIKAGVGNYFTSYMEAFFNTKRSEKYSYGLHIKHFSSRLGAIDRQNSGNAENGVYFNFKSFIRQSVLSGAIDFQYNRVYFYGYRPFTSTIPAKAEIQQNFNIYNAQLHYTNKQAMNKHSYDLGLAFHYMANHYKGKEQEIDFHAQTKAKINPFQTFTSKTEVSISKTSDELGILNRNLLRSELLYHLGNEQLKLHFGGRVIFQDDTLKSESNWRVYPKLYFSWSVWKNRLNISTGLEGNTQKKLWRDMIAENPFLASNASVLHTNQRWESFASIQTQFASPFNWQIKASYGSYQNLYFFMNNENNSSKFIIQYERNSIPVFHLMNEVILNLKNFKTSFKTEFFQYDLQTLAKAWHRPLLTNTLTTSYRNASKFSAQISLYHLAGISAFDIKNSKSVDLQEIIDLAFKMDYQLSPNWSCFIKGNNLLAQAYQRYLYYDVRTIELIGGITFAF